MGVAMQWTMPKIIFLNGVNDAPFFFYSSLFSIAIVVLWGKLIMSK
jgi:hypothetical protein